MAAAAVDHRNEKVNNWLHETYASVAANNNKNNNHREQELSLEEKRSRTYTFYNLNTETDISNLVVRALCQKFELEASEFIYKLYRDSRYRSRYVVTFVKQEHFNALLEEGITINGTKIRGSKNKPTRFYMPNFPGFCGEREVRDVLPDSNKIAFVKQRFSKDFGIAFGGWHIGLTDTPKENFFVNFEGEHYKVLCTERRHYENVANDQTRHQTPGGLDQNNQDGAESDELDQNKDQNNKDGAEADDRQTENNNNNLVDMTPMSTDPLKITKDPLAITKEEQDRYESLLAKGGKVSAKELEERTELQNRITCTVPSYHTSPRSDFYIEKSKNPNLKGDPPEFNFCEKLIVDLPKILPDLSDDSEDAMSDVSHSTIKSNISAISTASRKRKPEIENSSDEKNKTTSKKKPKRKRKKSKDKDRRK